MKLAREKYDKDIEPAKMEQNKAKELAKEEYRKAMEQIEQRKDE
jgi:hypothetical protein